MKNFSDKMLVSAAILCATAVGIGAFGAHALKNLLETSGRTAVFETATKYQFLHGLGIFVLYFLYEKLPSKILKTSFFLMLSGTFIFSGSLYLLCLTEIKKFGMITPVGGILLILAWLLIVYEKIKKTNLPN